MESATTEQNEPMRCAFCALEQRDGVRLVAWSRMYICDGCVELCVEILDGSATYLPPYDVTLTRLMRSAEKDDPQFTARRLLDKVVQEGESLETMRVSVFLQRVGEAVTQLVKENENLMARLRDRYQSKSDATREVARLNDEIVKLEQQLHNARQKEEGATQALAGYEHLVR